MKPYQVLATMVVLAAALSSAPAANAETTLGSVLTTPVTCTASGSCTGAGSAVCSLTPDSVADADDCANARKCGPGYREWTAEVDWTEVNRDDSIRVEILCGGTVKASETCVSQLYDRRENFCTAQYDAKNGDGTVSCNVVVVKGNPSYGTCRLAEPPNPVELAEALIDDLEGNLAVSSDFGGLQAILAWEGSTEVNLGTPLGGVFGANPLG